MRFQDPEAKKNSSLIDITPVVDTVFNLLIFFALSLNFISTPGIRVQLPKSAAQEITREKKDLRVVLTARDQLYLNEKPVDLNGLGAQFKKAADSNRDTQILIQADQRVAHGKVVQVMDLARSAGLYRLAIVTQPKPSKER
ncbi:MAG: biopolymer transporter ExbD [Deltaproteobacteria bacterium]|nr:biopolymer transporter ExbD [Deltaproteobacteria bacterium]